MDALPHPLSPQDCLVAVMLAVSASDDEMRESELNTIQSVIGSLPIFTGYDSDRLRQVASVVFEVLDEEAEGLDAFFGLIRGNLPDALNETAYAIACDVGAADGHLYQEELRLLQEIRHELNIDRLTAAAIERGARARYRVLKTVD